MSKQRIENLMHTFKISLKNAKEIDALLRLIRKERDYETLNDCMALIDQILGGYGVVTANYYPLICCWGDYVDGKRTL